MYKRQLFVGGLIAVTVAIIAFTQPVAMQVASPEPSLAPLFSDIDLYTWYEAQSGFTGSDITFGIYVTYPVSETLFVWLWLWGSA